MVFPFARRRLVSLLPNNAIRLTTNPRRTLIPAPAANSGPITERRADRELPNINPEGRKWLRTLPIFAVVVGAAMLGIFNYQKSSSSVVSSTLYALRTSPKAREILGDQIYFAQKIPWISGEMNQLHGRIDISFWVKGTKAQGKMRFRSIRPDRMSYFRTEVWSLETEGGNVVQLLENNYDPFRQE
ncbi:cytochrome oxidase complex assembly protein 1-domain-containing protein [Aspergillus filifer]